MELKQRTYHAADIGNTMLLRSLIRRNAPIHGSCAHQSARRGHTDCLELIHQYGGYWNEKTCAYAAYRGSLECLRYAHSNGCPWDSSTLSLAVLEGNIDCVSYYIKHTMNTETKTDSSFCKYAAYKGNLECLTALHKAGYPWDSSTTIEAFRNNNMDCLRYAIENGCPFSMDLFTRGVQSPECAEYLDQLKNKIHAAVKIQSVVRGVLLRNKAGVHNPHCHVGQRFLRRMFYLT